MALVALAITRERRDPFVGGRLAGPVGRSRVRQFAILARTRPRASARQVRAMRLPQVQSAFRDVAHPVQTFEVRVLRPEGGVMPARACQYHGICQWQLVIDA